MAGRMIEFDAGGATAPGYLATPATGTGPGVMVLHAWWGLTEPFRETCDRLAEAGFVALAPDLYRGKTTASVEEADALAGELNQEEARALGDVAGAAQYLRQHAAPGALGVIGFSLGGAFALDLSVRAPEEVGAVVVFYATYTGPDYSAARASYLCHFAERDPFESPESVAALEQALREAGRQATFYTYPGTTHWFFEANRPDAYDANAAALTWERTLTFLNAELRRA